LILEYFIVINMFLLVITFLTINLFSNFIHFTLLIVMPFALIDIPSNSKIKNRDFINIY